MRVASPSRSNRLPAIRADGAGGETSGWRAAIEEGLPLFVAAGVFVVLGAISAALGLDLGPNHIHLSILFYALAAVAATGAILAGLKVSEGPERRESEAPPGREDGSEDFGRPPPVRRRDAEAESRPAPASGDPDRAPGSPSERESARYGPSDEVDSALHELDGIRSALDRRPPRKRRPDRS